MSFTPVQAKATYALSGSGVAAGATSVVLKSFQGIDGANLTMADFGSVGYVTIEPGNGSQEEQVSFTGVTQNANGTATLTGVKTVLFVTPYTESSGLAKTHPGSATVVVSNTAGYYGKFGVKENDEVLTGYWEAPDPITGQGLVTRDYMLALINGGDITTNALVEAGTAGETISANDVLYLKAADGRWWKALATTASLVDDVQLGIAQGAGTAGNAITGGVLRRGVQEGLSGGSAGLAYVSDTGTLATTAGTVSRVVGNWVSATEVVFDPAYYYVPTANQKAAMSGGGNLGTPSSSNKFMTESGQILSGVFSMTAGATINGATLPVPVYQSTSTNKVLACDGNDLATLKFIGFAVSNSTDANPINVKTAGVVGGFTGLDEGVAYYLSDTVGTIQNTPGTYAVMVGVAVSTTQLLIQTGKRRRNGVVSFSTTDTSAIDLGFRPARIRATASWGTSSVWNQTAGSWVNEAYGTRWVSVNPDSEISIGTSTSGILVAPDTNAATRWVVTITSVTNTGFTFSAAKTSTPADLYIEWEAEGDF